MGGRWECEGGRAEFVYERGGNVRVGEGNVYVEAGMWGWEEECVGERGGDKDG